MKICGNDLFFTYHTYCSVEVKLFKVYLIFLFSKYLEVEF